MITHLIFVFFAILNGLQFDPDNPAEPLEAILEKLSVCLVKFIFHHAQITDRETEQLALLLALNSELPL